MALALADRGASIVGTARTYDEGNGPSGDTLKGTAELIEKRHGKIVPMTSDIRTSTGAGSVVDRAMAEFGKIDILFNNAGIHPHRATLDLTIQEWDDLIAINLNAPFLMMKAALPVMVTQGYGNVINVSSGAGARRADPINGAYGSTKAAIDRLSFNLAEEVREYNIAVNAWAPGIIATDMNAGYQAGESIAVVERSALWLMAQDAGFTGRSVRREEFGASWGPGSSC
jgi:NAD(P)-dependent dehydrogenase (short-subunit alcohol dehydrogenase family)